MPIGVFRKLEILGKEQNTLIVLIIFITRTPIGGRLTPAEES